LEAETAKEQKLPVAMSRAPVIVGASFVEEWRWSFLSRTMLTFSELQPHPTLSVQDECRRERLTNLALETLELPNAALRR
jgi:hypothetical protein